MKLIEQSKKTKQWELDFLKKVREKKYEWEKEQEIED
jgi:hypothetical protein